MESRTQGLKPRTQKNSKTKNTSSEDKSSQGQEQECSRQRTEDTGASVLQKKIFQAISKNIKERFSKESLLVLELHSRGFYVQAYADDLIGVARGGGMGPGPPPIKIPLTAKSYDNIAWRCLVAVFFSNYAHNNN